MREVLVFNENMMHNFFSKFLCILQVNLMCVKDWFRFSMKNKLRTIILIFEFECNYCVLFFREKSKSSVANSF